MPVFRVALVAFGLLAGVSAPAAAQEPPAPTPEPTATPTPTPTPAPEPRIADGVSAGGVDVSGLTVAEATLRLEQELAKPLAKPVIVAVAGRRYRLRVAKTEFSFDAARTAKRAYYAGRDRKPVDAETGGTAPSTTVALAVRFRRGAVRDWVKKVARRARLKPRNAYVRITLTHVYRRRAKAGRRLPHRKVRKQIERALADPARPRLLKPGRKRVKPKITTREVQRRYRTVITVDKRNFRLRLFKRLRWKKSYGVAIGQPAYPTPSGLFAIQSKQVNPTWTAPNSPWAGEMAGQSVRGGDPNNPLKARWMGVTGAVGIHGTGQEYSIGSAASHGCIRMRVADVIDLYKRVPLGTPVLIR